MKLQLSVEALNAIRERNRERKNAEQGRAFVNGRVALTFSSHVTDIDTLIAEIDRMDAGLARISSEIGDVIEVLS